MKKAIYAGSFDPLTNGHLWVIEEASKLFDEVIVAIGVNPDKKSYFSEKEKLEMLKESLKHLPNIQIDSFKSDYLVSYAKEIGASYLIRGIRSESDYSYEKIINNVNYDLNPNIRSIFLMPPKELGEVSSSFVKGLVGPEGWPFAVSKLVPNCVFEKLKEKFLLKYWKLSDLNPFLFNQMLIQYSPKKRSYHNTTHIANCLTLLEKYKHLAEKLLFVSSAIFFHDFFDDTKPYDKLFEVTSDLAARQFCFPDSKTYITKLIEATAHKSEELELQDQKLISDIDLAILGSSEEEYKIYSQQIRKEYSFVDDLTYIKGRKNVLKHFLGLRDIYYLSEFKNRFEKQARKNLLKELQNLADQEKEILKELQSQKDLQELEAFKKLHKKGNDSNE
jgi:pantetheine-phosphate adenylyltransferase